MKQDETGTARNWIGTLNNPEEEPEDYLKTWSEHAEYVTGQLEKGEQGTEHIQYALHMAKPTRLSALKKICKRSHF